MTAQLAQQADAGRHATTRDSAIDAERRLSVRTAVALLRAGHTNLAWDTLARSVERQAFLTGGIPKFTLGRAAVANTGWTVLR